MPSSSSSSSTTCNHPHQHKSDEELRVFLLNIFKDIDESGDGLLSIDECMHALERAHLPHDLTSVQKMRYAIRHERFIDGKKNKVGRDITFEEFFDFYKQRYRSLARKFEELYSLQKRIRQSSATTEETEELFCKENGKQEAESSIITCSSMAERKTILMSALKEILERYLEEETFCGKAEKFMDDALLKSEEEDFENADLWKNPGGGILATLRKQRQEHEKRLEEKRARESESTLGQFRNYSPSARNQFILKIFKKLDLDGDGEVSFEEFAKTLILVPQFQLDSFLDGVMSNVNFYQDNAPDYLPARQVFSNISSNPYYLGFKKAACVFGASATARIVTAPADRLRIIMMVSDQKTITMKQAAARIRQDGRFRGWFQGNGSNTIKLASELAVKLQTFDKIYAKITGDNDPDNATFITRLLAGAVAGFSATLVSQPSEVVRCTIAASPVGRYSGFIDAARKMYASGGVLRFYAGITCSATAIVPFSAIDLSINSSLKSQARRYMQEHNQVTNYPLLFGCGMVSSIAATISTFPLYVMRTRIAVKHQKFAPAVRELYSVAGFRGFYRGLVPALVKIVPASTVGYFVYDLMDKSM